ncbi:MAG: Mor transcription activator family protein [Pseudomonadota bacterium]
MSFGSTLVAAIKTGCEMDDEKAKALAAKIIAGGAENGDAGAVLYWPQRFGYLNTKERDAAIRDLFTGRNLREICREFEVSPATVYRAIGRG